MLAGVAVVVKPHHVQYAVALATGSLRAPYFDVNAYLRSPNCDGAEPCESRSIKVMNYNVLCRLCGKKGFDGWEERRPYLEKMVARYDADLLGTQELVTLGDVEAFARAFPQFQHVTFTIGAWGYGDSALFYRKDRFDALASGQMWLGPNPAVPLGMGWKAWSFPRYVNWVYLRQKNDGFRFLYINTHFDNNTTNNVGAVTMFADIFAPLAAVMPIIVTGDFNLNLTAPRYAELVGDTRGSRVLNDAFDLALERNAVRNFLDRIAPPKSEPISGENTMTDHIYLAGPGENNVSRWVKDASTYGKDGRRPSDHSAVYAEVSLRSRANARRP